MTTILVVSVGGSHQPIVTAISSLRPDRVIFVCSDGPKGSKSQVVGEGTPCEVRKGNEIIERLKNIPTQLKLNGFDPDSDLVLVQNPDDLSECYQAISEKICALQRESPGINLRVDYTGGTKTMSLALGLAAIDCGVQLFLTTSIVRENLIRVETGEFTELASISAITIKRKIEQFLPIFLRQYNYPAAIAELNNLLQSIDLPSEVKPHIRELRNFCTGLDAWDRFDHTQAWELLEPHMKQMKRLGLFLKRVMSSRVAIDPEFESCDGIPGHGYEIVEDLLLNADRRAAQQRYDDAVGRLYRALELLAQIRLYQTYNIQTGDVNLEKLPETLREEYASKHIAPNGRIQLALRNSYELLSHFSNDSIGGLYQEQKNSIINALQIRNHSLFAHGFQPITAKDYQNVNAAFGGLIQAGIKAVIPPKLNYLPVQFPIVIE